MKKETNPCRRERQKTEKQQCCGKRNPLTEIVPGAIRVDQNLNKRQRFLYGLIDLEITTENRVFADLLNVSVRTIQRDLDTLQEAGHIRQFTNGENRVLEAMTPDWKPGTVRIPLEALRVDDLTLNEVWILARINDLSPCTLQNGTIAYELDVSRRRVQQILQGLRDRGFIEKDTDGEGPRELKLTSAADPYTASPHDTDFTPHARQSSSGKEKNEQRNDVERTNAQQKTNEKQMTTTIQSIVDQLDVEPQKPLAVVYATKKKARELQEKTGVPLDYNHLRTVLFLTSEQVQDAIKAYEAMEVLNPSAALQELLNRAVNDELNDVEGREISPRAMSWAEDKTNALLNCEGNEGDRYMAYLFDTNQPVAERAYGYASDVAENEKARQPLKLFTFYAKKLLNGEDICTQNDEEDGSEPTRCHRHIT